MRPSSRFLFLLLLSAGTAPPLHAQPARTQFQDVVRREGEVFVAVLYAPAAQADSCRLEDLFASAVSFADDTLLADYHNYTESFCEATKLETRLRYRVPLASLDPARAVLVRRDYSLRAARLLEGRPAWYELHLHTRQGRPDAAEHDLLEGKTRRTSTFRLLFRTQAGARQAQAALRQLLR